MEAGKAQNLVAHLSQLMLDRVTPGEAEAVPLPRAELAIPAVADRCRQPGAVSKMMSPRRV